MVLSVLCTARVHTHARATALEGQCPLEVCASTGMLGSVKTYEGIKMKLIVCIGNSVAVYSGLDGNPQLFSEHTMACLFER